MEPSTLNTIIQEIEQEAPILAGLRQRLVNPIPEGYDELLADQVMGPVRLVLWQVSSENPVAFTEQRNQRTHGDSQNDQNEMIEKILPSLLQTLESEDSGQYQSIVQEASKHKPLRHKIILRRIYIAAACTLTIVATIALRFLIQASNITGITPQLTAEESMVFLEANAEEMEVEDLIEWGILEQEDLDFQPEVPRYTDKDSL